jgi:photosystem II stability/assembly factor-like uncharacterized protein
MRRFFFILLGLLSNALPTFAQWQSLNGPSGDGATEMVQIGNRLLIGTYNGVFRSDDQGNNWQLSGEALRNIPIVGLVRQGTAIFAFSEVGSRLFRSDTDGNSWTEIPTSGLPAATFHQMVVTDDALFISFPSLYRSTDGGSTWSAVNIPGPLVYYYTKMIPQGNTLYVMAPFNGLYYSDNNGLSWTNIAMGLPGLPNAATVKDDRIIVAYNTSNGFKIARSTNQGNSWTTDTNVFQWNIDCMASDNQFAYLVSGLSVWRSSLTGNSWTSIAGQNAAPFTALTNVSIPLRMKLYTFNNQLFACAQSGLYRSMNSGQTWLELSNGLLNAGIQRVIANGNTLFVNANTGLYKYTNQNWQVQTGNPTPETYIYSISNVNNAVYAGAQYRLWSSTDNGQSWQNSAPPFNDYTDVVANGDYMIVGSSNGIYRTNNNGISWEEANQGMSYIDIDVTVNPFIRCLLSDGDTVWAASLDRLYYSINRGQNWQVIDEVSGAYRLYKHQGNIFRVQYNKVLRSSDGGLNWFVMDFQTSNRISSMAFTEDTWYAGALGGVLASNDQGQHWTLINQDFPPRLSIRDLLIFNGQMYAGTSSEGVWKLSLSPVSNKEPIPQEQLYQIYPNPIKEKATLLLPTDASYSLSIFNGAGQLQRFDVVKGPQVEIDRNRLTPGMYLLQISSKEQDTKHLLMLVQD